MEMSFVIGILAAVVVVDYLRDGGDWRVIALFAVIAWGLRVLERKTNSALVLGSRALRAANRGRTRPGR